MERHIPKQENFAYQALITRKKIKLITLQKNIYQYFAEAFCLNLTNRPNVAEGYSFISLYLVVLQFFLQAKTTNTDCIITSWPVSAPQR